VKIEFTGKEEEEKEVTSSVPAPKGDEKQKHDKKGKKKENKGQKAGGASKVIHKIPEVEGGFYDEQGFYILPNNQGFYDPDGYKFNELGFDEFGGHYDNDGYYHPGEANKHEFPDYKESDFSKDNYSHRKGGETERNKGGKKTKRDYEEDDDLIKAFERGDDDDYYEE
jgi:hypothetical protein